MLWSQQHQYHCYFTGNLWFSIYKLMCVRIDPCLTVRVVLIRFNWYSALPHAHLIDFGLQWECHKRNTPRDWLCDVHLNHFDCPLPRLAAIPFVGCIVCCYATTGHGVYLRVHGLNECWGSYRNSRHIGMASLTSWGIIPGMGTANERRRYIVTSSLIGWAHALNDPCLCIVN